MKRSARFEKCGSKSLGNEDGDFKSPLLEGQWQLRHSLESHVGQGGREPVYNSDQSGV
jgi:hypothetical protein